MQPIAARTFFEIRLGGKSVAGAWGGLSSTQARAWRGM
jgi:hypothetical protein